MVKNRPESEIGAKNAKVTELVSFGEHIGKCRFGWNFYRMSGTCWASSGRNIFFGSQRFGSHQTRTSEFCPLSIPMVRYVRDHCSGTSSRVWMKFGAVVEDHIYHTFVNFHRSILRGSGIMIYHVSRFKNEIFGKNHQVWTLIKNRRNFLARNGLDHCS